MHLDINDNEGPVKYKIWDDKYTCNGCKYRKRTLFKSGRNPIYNTQCTLVNDTLDEFSWTPNWCPLLESAKRDDKINKIIE
jgi:hypothetical protein